MADGMDPALLVLGGDGKRLRWLTHHVTSRWPAAQVTIGPSDTDGLIALVGDRHFDALLFQIDFAHESTVDIELRRLAQALRTRPGVHCVILADNGTESAAVRAMKAGARDYLPLAGLTGTALLASIDAALAQRRAAAPLPNASGELPDAADIKVPGYSIIQEIATSNFSSVLLARSERLRARVILKVMKRGTSQRELDDANRFQREYEIISSVAHGRSPRYTTSASCRTTCSSPWNTFPAATCATGCAIR